MHKLLDEKCSDKWLIDVVDVEPKDQRYDANNRVRSLHTFRHKVKTIVHVPLATMYT